MLNYHDIDNIITFHNNINIIMNIFSCINKIHK